MSQLSTRAAHVLGTLVAEYIDSGEPVGSARLMHVAGLGVSSATIRNTLAELEDLGYLQQPHTSAGRIPTDRGYRFYVDQLLAAPRSVRSGAAVEAQLRRDAGTPALAEDVLAAGSQVLAILPASGKSPLGMPAVVRANPRRMWNAGAKVCIEPNICG
jgi:heat-inducible transcriptional repressor